MSKGYTYRKYYENIANAIREKNGTNTTYKTSEMANAIKELNILPLLQDKTITLNENGSFEINVDDNYDAINDLTIIVSNIFEGFNLKNIGYDHINTQNINNIQYSFNLKNEIENNPSTDWYEKFRNNTSLIYMPYVDTSNVTDMRLTWRGCEKLQNMPNVLNTSNVRYINNTWNGCYLLQNMPEILNISNVNSLSGTWQNCSSLQNMPEVLDTSNVNNMSYAWYYCYKLPRINLTSVAKVTNFSGTWDRCDELTFLHFTEWKQGNISLSNSSKLEAESVHYIIQNAMNISDGAVNRTLTLHSTAKTNWQNSEYYNDDLTLLTTKGISVA